MLAYISTPFADLRLAPQPLRSQNYSHHPQRASQLLFGEKISILESQGAWRYIQAHEQQRFCPKRGWIPYEGWVRKNECSPLEIEQQPNLVVSQLSATLYKDAACSQQALTLGFGTLLLGSESEEVWEIILPDESPLYAKKGELRELNRPFSREQLLRDALLFLGLPYLWGGRSSVSREPQLPISSVDCSGYISLIFRAQNIHIPRDAHDQWLKAEPLTFYQATHLIFLRPLTPQGLSERITHVMLVDGKRDFIHAVQTGDRVRYSALGRDIFENLQGGETLWHILHKPYPYQVYYSKFI